MADPTTSEDLTAALTRLLGTGPVRARAAAGGITLPDPPVVTDLRRLSAGASRETWAFAVSDAVAGTPSHPLVLQRVRPGLGMDGPSPDTEGALLAAARRAEVPVPFVIADAEACAAEIGPGLVCTHVAGETLGPRIVRDDRFAVARRQFAGDAGRALAAIHAMDLAGLEGLGPVDTLGRLREGLDGLGVTSPTFELTLHWLHAARPPARPPVVVHGDFRMGNLIVDDDGIRAVLDWELAHLGDPVEDLGWLCVRAWRFGGDGVVGGVADLGDLLAAYRDAGGGDVDPGAVRWWIVAGTLTWGLICAVQAHRHLDGHVRSMELAAIGRRVCETEYDLLDLLDVAGAAGPAPTGDAPESVHGRPTAAELVNAVRGHLQEVVAPVTEGAQAYGVRVAVNALGIVERELAMGPAIEQGATARLAALGFDTESALAAALRRGEDTDEPAVLAAVRALVVDRVRVANPRWLHAEDQRPAPA